LIASIKGERTLKNFRIMFSALASSLLCALPACAGDAIPSPPSVKEKPIMSAESIVPSLSAPISAQDLTSRLLALIKDIHSAQDITPELIRRHIGHLGWINPKDHNDFGVNGQVTGMWYFGVNSIRPSPGKKLTSLAFGFSDSTHTNADMSPVCVALDNYKQPLIAAGFTAKLGYARFDEEYWLFVRDNLVVRVDLRGKHNLRDVQTCVETVTIHALS
jgi:hypothetical protein